MEKMLEIYRKHTPAPIITKEIKDQLKPKDIIITKYKDEESVNEDGSITHKRIPINVNITKKINEEKKLIKTYTAEEKLIELEKVFSK